MLHASVATDEVACEAMSWGSFYVFVSGQRRTARRVLLHGAADVPWIEDDSGEDRRSCELRYTIQATPEAAAAPGAEEEKNDDDAGLGGLFDDSPDSESGSPDLMSAAWVERMARDPVFQEMIALAETGEPVSDIASWLERLDLAERRQMAEELLGALLGGHLGQVWVIRMPRLGSPVKNTYRRRQPNPDEFVRSNYMKMLASYSTAD